MGKSASTIPTSHSIHIGMPISGVETGSSPMTGHNHGALMQSLANEVCEGGKNSVASCFSVILSVNLPNS